MWSDLVGGHDPQLGDGGVAGAGDHVGDAVGDVFGGEDLGLLVKGIVTTQVRVFVGWACEDRGYE